MTRRRLSLWEAQPPSVAIELASNRVSGARVAVRGGRAVVTAHTTEALPPGALTPSLTAENLPDRATALGVLGRVLDRLGRPRRIGLVLPDIVGKVSFVRFERVPSRADDLDRLVRWQVRKAAPFSIDEAQVAYVRGAAGADGQDFIVTMARRSVIAEFETLCAEAGAHAGLVDLSTFNVVNAVLAGADPPSADWLLVNVTSDFASIVILRGSDPIFFRSRGTSGDESLSDLVHQTAMYYEDRLQGAGFARVLLCGSAAGEQAVGDADQLRQSLESRLSAVVEAVDPRSAAALTDRIAAAPELLDTLAPLIGLLVRGREVAA